jgi:hypothetical protein
MLISSTRILTVVERHTGPHDVVKRNLERQTPGACRRVQDIIHHFYDDLILRLNSTRRKLETPRR